MIKNFYFKDALFFLLHLVSAEEKINNKSALPKPVSVYILSGQSNMVGAGRVDGGSSTTQSVMQLI
tara:strand:- start:97 stop:294 length:198 start_codon:yes stop_codon:yes gene_type:complete